MIRVEGLEFAYPLGAFRLSLTDLEIEAGRKAAVIGPSGSGKTTLLHLIAGIVPPDRGRITTCGKVVTAMSDGMRRDFRVRKIGMVFQEFELLDYLDVQDNILLPYHINRSLRLGPDVRSRARELARQVGIADKLDRPVDRLSQGERQRVAVCRALLPGPELLLADEPTGNLDPENRALVLDILFRYAEENESTLVTVTHDHGFLDRFDRVVDLKESAA